MAQLEFTDYGPVRTAERQKRFDAFWGPLNEKGRAAARVACDFFAFAEEVNWQMAMHYHYKTTDSEKSQEAFVRSQMYCKVALGKFYIFGRLTGCKDEAETTDRLNKLIAYSQKTGWRIYPDWWTKVPSKNTKYFIDQFKIHAGQYATYLGLLRKAAEEEQKANGKRKGASKEGGAK